MGKCLQDYFSVNPLEDPIVKRTLEEVHMSGQQLVGMSVKELNRRLTGCSSFVVSKLKKCRRTLKNRGYAKSCRIKRIVARSELEQVNARLIAQLAELKHQNRSLADQVNRLLSAATKTTTTMTTTGCGGEIELAAPTGQHSGMINGIRYDLPEVSSVGQSHLIMQKRQHQEMFHVHELSQMHENMGAYEANRHHYHSSGYSTCNSSPVSSSSVSSSTSSIGFAATNMDACRSLQAELEFVVDDRQQGSQPPLAPTNCHHLAVRTQANVTEASLSLPALYTGGEIPTGWSAAGVPHQMAGFH